MSELDRLIQKLCPNGVRYVRLGEYTIWDKNFRGVPGNLKPKTHRYKYMLASDLSEVECPHGEVKILSTGEYNGYACLDKVGDYVSDGPVVTLPWGGDANIKYHDGLFVTTDNRIATSLDPTILDTKFIYHYMVSKRELISSFYRGSVIKHPDMFKVLSMEIPLPPIEVQEEIVRILDSFKELEKELEKEQMLRRKQFGWYSDILFDDVVCSKDTKYKQLKDIWLRGVNSKLSVSKASKLPEGGIRCFTSGDREFAINDYLVDGEYIFANDGGKVDFKYMVGKANYTSHVLAMTTIDEVNTKYLFHYLENKKEYIYDNVFSGSTIKNMSKTLFGEMKIPIPSIKKQNEIVQKLDYFHTLAYDIDNGLPREIELRQKHYEYYRDKLLNFKELM